MKLRRVVLLTVVFCGVGALPALAQGQAQANPPATAAAGDAVRVDGNSVQAMSASLHRMDAGIQGQRQTDFHEAVNLIGWDQVFQHPREAGAQAKSDFEAALVKNLSGKNVDEVIALAARRRAEDPELEPRMRAAERPAKLRATASTFLALASQTELYKLQHDEARPDVQRYPNWEQFTGKTSATGELVADGPFGPYLVQTPRNALRMAAKVTAVKESATDMKPIHDAEVGWIFAGDGKLYALDEKGMAMDSDELSRLANQAQRDLPPVVAPAQTREEATKSALQSGRSMLELYRLQHYDRYPDFEHYPDWQQLTGRTDSKGGIAPAGTVGPYLHSAMVNPLRQASRVMVIKTDVGMKPVEDKQVGWVLIINAKGEGRLEALDPQGAVLGAR